MIKYVLLLLLLINVHASAGETKNQERLNYLSQGCHIAHSDNEVDRTKCLKNVGSKINLNIIKHYNQMKDRDLTHLLNTKALELLLLRNNCSKLPVSNVVKIDCEIQSDLSLLNYIEERYESP